MIHISLSRLRLKDGTSVVIQGSIEDLYSRVNKSQFIRVTNYYSKEDMIYNRDYINCILKVTGEEVIM